MHQRLLEKPLPMSRIRVAVAFIVVLVLLVLANTVASFRDAPTFLACRPCQQRRDDRLLLLRQRRQASSRMAATTTRGLHYSPLLKPSSSRLGLPFNCDPNTMTISTTSSLRASVNPDGSQDGNQKDDTDKHTRSDPPLVLQAVEPLLFSLPIGIAVAAFYTHAALSESFRDTLHRLSSSSVVPAEGSQDSVPVAAAASASSDMVDLIRAGLNGPVVTSVAILFGTLVASTITKLIQRNEDILTSRIQVIEDIREARLYLDCLVATDDNDKDHARRARNTLNAFANESFYNFWNDQSNLVNLRKLTPHLEDCVMTLHLLQGTLVEEQSKDPSKMTMIAEAQKTIQRLRQHQVDQMTLVQQKFPTFHYANLVTLAATIAFIFLLETTVDPHAATTSCTAAAAAAASSSSSSSCCGTGHHHSWLLDAAEPQLALCWSLLMGTFSMLFVVIFDLSSPLGGLSRRVRIRIRDRRRGVVNWGQKFMSMKSRHSNFVPTNMIVVLFAVQMLFTTEAIDRVAVEKYAMRDP